MMEISTKSSSSAISPHRHNRCLQISDFEKHSFKRFARQDFYSTFPQQLIGNLDGWFSIPYEYRWWDQASTQQIWLEAVLNLWLDSLSGLHSWLLCFLFRVLWFVIKYVTFIKRLPFESWQLCLCPPVSDVPSFSLSLPYWARINI